jgi:starch phosphorylase
MQNYGKVVYMQTIMKKDEIKDKIIKKLSHDYGVTLENAKPEQFYGAVLLAVRDMLTERRHETVASTKGKKTAYYLCMEFLIGRSLRNHLYNLEITEEFEAALKEMGYTLSGIYDLEPDAGLGNGGLGRLAACFLDSAAALGYPLDGYSIRYEFGIFRQKIVDGWQTELPDLWLEGGDIWMVPRKDEAVTVRFDGQIMEDWSNGNHQVTHQNYHTVIAVPYDMMISGYHNTSVSLLRLWSATSSSIDMGLFHQGDYLRALEQKSMAEVISKILYPPDHHPEGKSLRLRQQYFLVSASIQDIVRKHITRYKDIANLSDKVVIHINETHPATAIPELMRILLDDYGYAWEDAWNVVTKTFAYTNHTIMWEALEVWPEDIFMQRLPRIYQIVKEINNRFCGQLAQEYHEDPNHILQMSIIQNGQIHMANLCVCTCFCVNGVSKIHSDIIKTKLFHNFSVLNPSKFTNITNGINYRRFMCQANPQLCRLVTKLTGSGFVDNPQDLLKLMDYTEDKDVLEELGKIKRNNKIRLAKYIKDTTQITVDTNSIFDVQVKRLHEYKRQLMNVLHILYLYDKIKENPKVDLQPRTFIFSAKAAQGYVFAKKIIHLICCLADEINNDKDVNDLIKVVFLEDYKVTLAELIIPAAEISEQISLAGTEASGTGNMKLMINGAITIGTMDGANVEIREAVGEENILIFGLRESEVDTIREKGYCPSNYFNNVHLRKVIDHLKAGVGGVSFSDIASSLIGGPGVSADPYMVLADFNPYCGIQKEAERRYQDPYGWNRMSLVNIAAAGVFASDLSIEEYVRKVWKIDRVSAGFMKNG